MLVHLLSFILQDTLVNHPRLFSVIPSHSNFDQMSIAVVFWGSDHIEILLQNMQLYPLLSR